MLEQFTGLTMDEEFRRLEQPPADSTAIFGREGDLQDPPQAVVIHLWGDIIAAGFAQYESHLRNGIPILTEQIPAKNRREALSWACMEQLKRHDLSKEMRIYLIGKRYSVEKKARGQYPRKAPDMRAVSDDTAIPDHAEIKTASCLGREYHLGRCSITRYSRYANAIDFLSGISPKLVDGILSGRIELTQRAVIHLTELPERDLKRVGTDPDRFFAGGFQLREGGEYSSSCMRTSRPSSSTTMLVKQMPDYDPDADISGLTLTIPSRISSIERTGTMAALDIITQTAKDGLSVQLTHLIQCAEKLLYAIGGNV